MRDSIFRTSGIPARFVTSESRITDKAKRLFMDAFEREALYQFKENQERFGDYYKMYNNELSTVELREFLPSLEELNDIFDQYEIPSNIYHHDLIGRVIRAFVGRFHDLEDKFLVTDLSEIGKNEYLQSIEDLFYESLKNLIEIQVQRGFAIEGIDPTTQQSFSSEEEQQAYLQMLQELEAKYSPESAVQALNKNFKSTGVKWATATLEKDEEMMSFKDFYSEGLKNFLLSGVVAGITKYYDGVYKKYNIDSRTLFHSKDIGKKYLQDFDYAGTLEYLNASQVIESFGDVLTIKEIESILGGKNLKDKNPSSDSEFGSTTYDSFSRGNFVKSEIVPYSGYHNSRMMQRIEDIVNLPLGFTRRQDSKGGYRDYESYIARESGFEYVYSNSLEIEDRFIPNEGTFQITDVYFKMQEYVGFLYHETEEGFPTVDIVTKDISKDFIKENNIKQIYNVSFEDIKNKQYVNTIVWHVRPYVYRGVKINSPSLSKPLYPIFEKMELQITGDNDFDVKLPISGFIGKNICDNMLPYQRHYNVMMNQARQLIEKELGMFFSVDLMSLPSEIRESGEVSEVLMNIRNMAKTIGLFPTVSNPDDIQNGGNFRNTFGVHNVTHGNEIQNRLSWADYFENKCYQAAGLNMSREYSETKYTTAEGIKLSNETMSDQIAHIVEDYNSFIRADKIQHLNIAQFAQSNDYDNSLFYTKDDASIVFLNFTKEHNIPIRRLGLTVTSDSKRRKDFENIKQVILNDNTLGIDIKSIASLMSSKSLTPLLDAADEARIYAEQLSEQEHIRKMQLEKEKFDAQMAQEEREWERSEISKERDRQNRLRVAYVHATGYIGRNQEEGDEAFARLEKERKLDQEDSKIASRYQIHKENIEFQESLANSREEIEERKLAQKDRQLDLREREIRSKEYTSEINKN